MAKSQYDIDREKEIERQQQEELNAAAALDEYQKQYEENKVFVGYQVELLKIRIENLRQAHDREVAHLREKYADRSESLETALKLQAKEYDVHLIKLNHEAEQLKEMQKTYTLKETFDRFMTSTFDEFKRSTENEFKKNREDRNMEAVKLKEDMTKEFKGIRDELSILKNWQSTQNGRMAVFSVILVVVMFLLNYFNHNK